MVETFLTHLEGLQHRFLQIVFLSSEVYVACRILNSD